MRPARPGPGVPGRQTIRLPGAAGRGPTQWQPTLTVTVLPGDSPGPANSKSFGMCRPTSIVQGPGGAETQPVELGALARWWWHCRWQAEPCLSPSPSLSLRLDPGRFMEIPAWCPQQGGRQQPGPVGLGAAGLDWFGAGQRGPP